MQRPGMSGKEAEQSDATSTSKGMHNGKQGPNRAGPMENKAAMTGKSTILAGTVVLWYLSSILTDAMNKKVQSTIRIPVTLTLIQFLSGGTLSAILLRSPLFNNYSREQRAKGGRSAASSLFSFHFKPLRRDELFSLLPISLCWTAGFIFTNTSFGQTDVSFTHAVKATEPAFLLAIATIFFGQRFRIGVWLTLVPIVVGIILVAVSELRFSVAGFLTAATSTCCFVLRSIFAKQIFAKGLVDNLNLFYYMSWISVVLTLPVAIFMEGHLIMESLELLGQRELVLAVLTNGVFHYAYNQSSMAFLAATSPLTHAITNTCRRFVVIMVAVWLFGKTVTTSNLVGMGVLMAGVFAYVYEKSKE